MNDHTVQNGSRLQVLIPWFSLRIGLSGVETHVVLTVGNDDSDFSARATQLGQTVLDDGNFKTKYLKHIK